MEKVILGKVVTVGCFFGGGVGSISCFDLDFVVEYFFVYIEYRDDSGFCL